MNIKIMDQKKEEVNHSKSFKLVMFSTTPALRAPPPYNRRGGAKSNLPTFMSHTRVSITP